MTLWVGVSYLNNPSGKKIKVDILGSEIKNVDTLYTTKGNLSDVEKVDVSYQWF